MSATSFADMDKGIDASWLSSAWGPSYFAPDAKQSLGDWRAAPLPQWTAGADVAANWGGSTYPVFSQSKHPAQAAEFAEWLNGDDRLVEHHQDGAVVTVPDLRAAARTTRRSRTSRTRSPAPPTRTWRSPRPRSSINGVPWPPFMTEALTESATVFAGVLDGKETLQPAFRNFQSVLVNYAKEQGFTVSS